MSNRITAARRREGVILLHEEAWEAPDGLTLSECAVELGSDGPGLTTHNPFEGDDA